MKKSIGVIFFFTLLFFCNYTFAQSCDTVPYQHIYSNAGFYSTHIKTFSFTSANDIYMLGFVTEDSVNNNTDGWIMRTTFHGTPLWSKVIGTSAEETINGIRNLQDGGYIFTGSTKYNSLYEVGWLAKSIHSGRRNGLWH